MGIHCEYRFVYFKKMKNLFCMDYNLLVSFFPWLQKAVVRIVLSFFLIVNEYFLSDFRWFDLFRVDGKRLKRIFFVN